jgi:hypothetical protein
VKKKKSSLFFPSTNQKQLFSSLFFNRPIRSRWRNSLLLLKCHRDRNAFTWARSKNNRKTNLKKQNFMFNKKKTFFTLIYFLVDQRDGSSWVRVEGWEHEWWSISLFYSENKVRVKKVFLFFIEQIVIHQLFSVLENSSSGSFQSGGSFEDWRRRRREKEADRGRRRRRRKRRGQLKPRSTVTKLKALGRRKTDMWS